MNQYFDRDSQVKDVPRDYVESGKANEFLRQVYAVMGLGLLITGLTAWFVASNFEYFSFLFQGFLRWIVIFAPLGLVIFLSARVHKMSFQAANLAFATYALVNGISFATIFLVYDIGSIFQTFLITGGTFGAMTLVGMTTKMDLTKYSSAFMMALIGLIIASVVNMFLGSGVMDWIISAVGVILFSGLTAYDTQRLMQIGAHADMESESVRKATIMGALALYLDFINLFLFLLRFFGGRD